MSARLRSSLASAAPLGLALSTGLLVVLAAPGVLPWRPAALLVWVAFVPILLALPVVRPRRAALLGLASGLVVNLGLCLWLPGLLARFGGLHPALAVAGAVGIAAGHSAGWVLWALVVRACSRALPLALVAPAAFVALERWAPQVFPYSLGLTQYRMLGLAQVAELGGPYVLSFLFVLVGAALAELLARRRRGLSPPYRSVAVAAALLAATLVFGQRRLRTVEAARAEAPAVRFGMIQPDAARSGWARGEGQDEDDLDRYQRLSARLEADHGPVDLLLWPEKGYPMPLRADSRRDYPEGNRRRVRRGFASPLVFGLTSVEPASRAVANSAALLGADGRLRVFYDKVELILFSEWLPELAQGWFGGGRRYRPGRRIEPIEVELDPREGRPGRLRLSVFICFESAFPAHVRRLAARGPDLLVNLTDDSWFGDTAEPEQHLSHAVFRAIESRRDLLRAAASGVSAHVAATGALEARTPVSLVPAEVVVVGEARLLELRSGYGPAGDALPWSALLSTLACLAAAARRRSGPKEPAPGMGPVR